MEENYSQDQNYYSIIEKEIGENIQDELETIIATSLEKGFSEFEKWLEKHFVEPGKVERVDRNSELLEKQILKDLLKSKNLLISYSKTPYVYLNSKYSNDVYRFAQKIALHLLSLPSESDINKERKNLAEVLFNVSYNSFVYRYNDMMISYLEEQGVTSEWPKIDNIEIHTIQKLEDRLKEEIELKNRIHLLDEKRIEDQIQKVEELNNLLEYTKEDFSKCAAELSLLKESYFFHEDKLYDDYVFGDLLPELKSVYNFLKEYKLYDSNWGYFCYCLTWYNSSSNNSPQKKLKLNIQNSDLSADDLGYILYLLKIHYYYESQLPYLNWIMQNLEIISGHGKTFVEKDYIKFNEKSIRSYKSGKSRPNFYVEINKKIQCLL